MAIQILPGNRSIGTLFGQGLGTGLGGGIDALVQQKMNQLQTRMQQQAQAPAFAALGIPQEQAAAISRLPPQIQQELIKNFSLGGQQQELLQLLGGGQPQYQQEQLSPEYQQQQQYPQSQEFDSRPQPGAPMSPWQPQQQPKMSLEDRLRGGQFEKFSPEQQRVIQEKIAQQQASQGQPSQVPTEQNLLGQQQMQQQPGKMMGALQKPLVNLLKKPLSTHDILGVAKFKQSERKLDNEEKRHIQKMEFEEKKFASKEKKEAFSQNKDIIHEVYDKAKGATENKMRLEKMKALVERGNLSAPFWYGLLKGIPVVKNFNLETLLNPDSEEFQKLSNDFIKNAKAIFGARVTEGEIDMFLKTVPTLSQSDAGKLRVIENLNLFAEGDLLRKNALKEILKENNGIPPFDLEGAITEKIAPQQEALHKKFIQISGPKTVHSGLLKDIVSTIPGVISSIPGYDRLMGNE